MLGLCFSPCQSSLPKGGVGRTKGEDTIAYRVYMLSARGGLWAWTSWIKLPKSSLGGCGFGPLLSRVELTRLVVMGPVPSP